MTYLKFTQAKITTITLSFIIISLVISCVPSEKPDEIISRADIEMMKENHIIPLNQAIKMYDKYSKDRVKILKDSLKKKYGNDFSDTRTVWFDIKAVKAYLKYIEENSNEAEGLSFYFSVNLDDNGKEKNHQTFFIAPTVKNVVNGDTIQSGYTIKNGKKVFLYEAFKGYLDSVDSDIQKASFFNAVLQGDDGLLFNKGNNSPPEGNN